MLERLDGFIQDSGAQLEDAFRSAGSSLPPEVSGEEMIRSFLDGSFERSLDENTQRQIRENRAAIAQIIVKLRAEFPGGHADPQFEARLIARVEQWRKEHPELQ
jgi:hypothetical protein